MLLPLEPSKHRDLELIIETACGPRFCPSASRHFYSWPLPFPPVCWVAVLSLCFRDSFKLRKTSHTPSFVTLGCHLLVMPIQKSTWTCVSSNADDEGEVFDLPQTPNRSRPATYSQGTYDSTTANAMIRLLDADGNQGILDDGRGVVVSDL